MARRKKVKDDIEACTVAMGPMIDCVFLLLMYFVSVSTIDSERQSKEVVLPSAEHGIVEEDESGRFIVDIEWDEPTYTPTYRVGSLALYDPFDMVPLIEHGAKMSGNSKFRVVIRADRDVPYEFTQNVMAAVAAANVPNMIFSTKDDLGNK